MAAITATASWRTYVFLILAGLGMVAWRRAVGGESGRALLREGGSPPRSMEWFAGVMSWCVGAMGVAWIALGLGGLVVKAF